MPDIESALQAIFRWFHVLAGITWIGHLYFFNFVNLPFQGGLAKELKPTVNPPLVLRALYFFRWGAMWTFLFGIALFALVYWPMGGNLFTPEGGMSERGMWVLFGGLLGTIMWFNVWFVIWPRQQKILGAMQGGPAAPRGGRAPGRPGLEDQHLPLGPDAVGDDRGLARQPLADEGGDARPLAHPGRRPDPRPLFVVAEGQDDGLTSSSGFPAAAARTVRAAPGARLQTTAAASSATAAAPASGQRSFGSSAGSGAMLTTVVATLAWAASPPSTSATTRIPCRDGRATLPRRTGDLRGRGARGRDLDLDRRVGVQSARGEHADEHAMGGAVGALEAHGHGAAGADGRLARGEGQGGRRVRAQAQQQVGALARGRPRVRPGAAASV